MCKYQKQFIRLLTKKFVIIYFGIFLYLVLFVFVIFKTTEYSVFVIIGSFV